MTELIIVLLIVLLISALALGSRARAARLRAGLPEGNVLYSDTDVDRFRNAALVSREYGLKGRPDYLVETSEGVVPVEIKSSFAPAKGHAYDSHVMQLACYCLLVEETTSADVPYGLIRYRDREERVEYTPELRDRLLSLLAEMREALESPDVHRNHSQARRCARCAFREICDEAL